jgi:DNA repair exonuclease SbcCD ATPase subunit
MRLERIRMRNWLRYAGEHSISLDGTIYGIVGQYADDKRRSNWSGKTSFVEAIRFALFGVHRAAREDGWITRDKESGFVELVTDNGWIIRRERKRGRVTQLTVEGPGGFSVGDDAQDLLNQVVGFDKDDFEVTCWFGQKQLARLVLARPSERFDLMSGWFGLAPLQRCEENVRGKLSTLSIKASDLRTKRTALEAQLQRLASEYGAVSSDNDELKKHLEESYEQALREVKAAKVKVDEAQAMLAQQEEIRRTIEQAAEFDRIVAKGKELNRQIAELSGTDAKEEEAREQLMQLRAAVVQAAENLKQKRSLARGEFDGRCPVAGIACPAAHEINAAMDRNRQMHDDAAAQYDEACRAEAAARRDVESAASNRDRLVRLVAQRDSLRQQASALKSAVEAAKHASPIKASEVNVLRESAQAAQRELAVAEAKVEQVQHAIELMTQLHAELAEVVTQLATIADEERVARAALRIFGRQGAQRRIAETALGEIEAGANEVLREAGIALEVRVLWGREGVGLAAWCGECGAPFPPSTRVKQCPRCGAERGPKVMDRLDVELSDRSGAAEDLAGAALQLSAASWLRRNREVSWSVALIDEPFGALDEANRRAFATHLVSMLRGRHGFEQAFVVAHDRDVLDGLPACLVVQAGDSGSTIGVSNG